MALHAPSRIMGNWKTGAVMLITEIISLGVIVLMIASLFLVIHYLSG